MPTPNERALDRAIGEYYRAVTGRAMTVCEHLGPAMLAGDDRIVADREAKLRALFPRPTETIVALDDAKVVEKMAEHLFGVYGDVGAIAYSDLLDQTQEIWRDDARAALAALKEVP